MRGEMAGETTSGVGVTRLSRVGPFLAVVPVLLCLMIACGGDGGGSGALPSPAETPVEDSEVPLGNIPPGTYTFEIVDQTLSFTVDSGWAFYGAGTGGRLLELQFGEPADPPELQAVTVFVTPGGPQAALDRVRDLDGVDVLDELEASVAGISGTRVSLSIGPEAASPTLLFSFEGGGGHYGLAPGNRAEIWILDLDEQALIVTVEGPEALFPEFLPTAEAVVESMEF